MSKTVIVDETIEDRTITPDRDTTPPTAPPNNIKLYVIGGFGLILFVASYLMMGNLIGSTIYMAIWFAIAYFMWLK